MRIKYCCFLALAAAQAQAGEYLAPDEVTQKVVVNGEQTDLDKGRDFVAGKIIVGKKAIADSGAQNVGEVLRREPAVSIGKDGRLGLMGLPGYTQIMVDGLPAAAGDPMAMDVAQIERIEIIKSATAATGPFGIAGTINIVRRQIERKALTQLRTGATLMDSKTGANVSLSSNQVPSQSALAYNYSLSASQKDTPGQQRYTSQQYSGERADTSGWESVSASADIGWTLSPEHKINIKPEISRIKITQDSEESRQWRDGEALRMQNDSRQLLDTYAVNTVWNWKINAEQRLTLDLRAVNMQAGSDTRQFYHYLLAGRSTRKHDDDNRMNSRFLTLDYKMDIGANHEFAAGLKLARNRSARDYTDLLNGAPDLSLAVLGGATAYRQRNEQFFVQDDWRYDRTLSFQLGLSAERRTIQLQDGDVRNEALFDVWSPSLHVAKKIGGDRKRQLRASLARTFQAPSAQDMLLRPTINRLAPCAAGGVCGANTIDSADNAGNPGLRPERALGLNLSYSHGFGDAGEAVVEVYTRQIANKTGTELALESVPWASVPRYITRPANLGDARVRGLNLEGRVPLRDWLVSGSIGFARSSVDELPGPYNHVAGQLPWRAKLGAAYTAKSLPLKVTLDANWLPADWQQQNALSRTFQSNRFTLDAGANWKIASQYRLIARIDNLFARDSRRIDQYAASLSRYSTTSGYARATLTLETTL